tara:strand:+ start:41 stop:2446 length:2406 start_codon:yes stop_codon:yes gene_type:complete
MKNILCVLFIIPFSLVGQGSVSYSILENFPKFENNQSSFLYSPAPIQFNKTNVFAPTIDLNCKPIGYVTSVFNCIYDSSSGTDSVSFPNELDTTDIRIYYGNNWESNTTATFEMFLTNINYNFNNDGFLQSYIFSSDASFSTNFSYNENNLIATYSTYEYFGIQNQTSNFQFEWTNNDQYCEVDKNNAVITSFQSDSIGNTLYQFDSLGKLISYTNISDYTSLIENNSQSNQGYIRLDTITFSYNNNDKISQSTIKKYYNYISNESTLDSIVIDSIKSGELIINYNWINNYEVELTFSEISYFFNYEYFALSSGCLNQDSITKYVLKIDSNLYITDINYLDTNLNTTNSSKYLFCDGDSTIVLGCQDIIACNYDSLANVSYVGPFAIPLCNYAEQYYDCNNNCLLDSDNDGICDELEVPGCTDTLACNFDYTVDDDDGSCVYPELYFDCYGNCLIDSDSDGICDELETPGCTDTLACNFNYTADNDDGSCIYVIEYYDCEGNCLNDFDSNGICDELEVYDCSDDFNCNYDIIGNWILDSFMVQLNIPVEDFFDDDEIELIQLIINNQSYSAEDFLDEFEFPMPSSQEEWEYILANGILIDISDNEEIDIVSFAITENEFNILTDENNEIITNYFWLNDSTISIDTSIDEFPLNVLNVIEANDSSLSLESTTTILEDDYGEEIYYTYYISFYCIFTDEFILGCTDQVSCNWNTTANIDDGSCIYAIEYYDCDGNCLNDFDLDGECDELDYDDGIGIDEILGDGNPTLIKIIDVLGKEQQEHKKGSILFYIYDNGVVEKKIIH